MGFSRTQTIYKLVFDDPDIEGLVVKVRRGSFGERIEFDAFTNGREQVDFFAQFLVEWNVEDDEGQPLPFTGESLWSLEEPTLKAIVQAWIDAAREVAGPLGQPSSVGDPSLEASMPMEDLSASLVS
jgi:hypothetical protein